MIEAMQSEWLLLVKDLVAHRTPYRGCGVKIFLLEVIRTGVLYLPQYPSGHFSLLRQWQVCPNTCFSCTTCWLGRKNVKGELDCFNCKTGFSLIIYFDVYKRKQLLASVSFWPLFIIASVAGVSQHMLFMHDLLVRQEKRKM